MAAADPRERLIAFNRFGFGARPGDANIAGNARDLLRHELATRNIGMISLDDPANADLRGTTAAIAESLAANYDGKLERAEAAMSISPLAPPMPQVTMGSAGAEMASPGASRAAAAPAKAAQAPAIEQQIFRSEARARFDKMATAPVGFVERLVHFWSNHFCVSVAKDNIVRAAAGPYEREAIRPFVLGRFADMLFAVEHHPAMLFFLDNQVSIGPDSRAGQRSKRGLNENLAREIFELHTLGVGGGYTQSDVTTFARILTGWTVAGRDGRLGEPGSFVFNASAHEPGDEVILGKTYAGGGIGQAEAVLADIARHPSTAEHIASKLVRHFIADDPPGQAVARLAKIFLDKDGDLMAVAHALIEMPEAWSTPLNKIRSPYEYVAAIRRAVYRGSTADPGQMLGWLTALGQPLWQPPGPNGFTDIAAAEASPEGMKVRLDIAWQAARQVKDIGNPSTLLDAIIGPAASPETRQAIARAESKQQGLALLLMSPEFQRR